MTTKGKYLVMILTFLILTECKKEDDRISINGITETDTNADLIGNVDQTDWRIDDKWTEKEENLFQENKSFTDQCYIKEEDSIVADTINIRPAYPNPFKTVFVFALANNLNINLKFVIVDNDLKILESGNLDLQKGRSLHLFDLSDNTVFKPNNLYRIYYKIFVNNYVRRGHGDIKKIE